ncbi:MAG: uncharacterized protein QOD51_1661, partial [Candidatus Eremiobacteraeota bacterium]|nr:uncharacterized protein [Candidatus Eremiobacteraeota bacterium]
MNYRCVVLHGVARIVDDADEKSRLLDALVDHLLPGRRAELRASTQGELDATQVVALRIDAVSAKVRTGGPTEPEKDQRAPIWGGVIPLALRFGEPQPDASTIDGVAAPALRRARC